MLHFFSGSDRHAVVTASQELINSLLGEWEQVRIDEQTYQPGIFTEISNGSSLFGTQFIYIIDTPSTQVDFKAEVIEALPLLADSTHVCIVLEQGVLAPERKKYEKYATTSGTFSAATAERFNAFAMADALCAKDKKRLWLLLQEARLAGLREEEIIGVLWWQLKTLRLAAHTTSASEAGLKDWPYQKAKKTLQSFPLSEVEKTAERLLILYHESHQGLRDGNLALEEFVLTV